MHEKQRTEAVKALDGPMIRIYPAVVAVRRASPAQLRDNAREYQQGLVLAATELQSFLDSQPMRILRFVLRDDNGDLPGAVGSFALALSHVAAGDTLDGDAVEAAWQAFKSNLAGAGVLVDEAPVGSDFDPSRHDAVAGSAGSNDKVMETLSPGLAAHGTRVVWARVRTGAGHLA